MKGIQTNKAKAFENWRINNINRYNVFIWLQLNYIKENAKVIQAIIELKKSVNPVQSAEKIKIYLDNRNISSFILDFHNKTNKYYIQDLSSIHKTLDLKLHQCLKKNITVNSYWEYRCLTKPQNCLTTDIDALENFNNRLVAVEAAQLFDTNNINEAIKHIFKTFKLRKNQVNPEQYLSHYNFANMVNGKSYILFHKINKKSELEDKEKCLLIENNKDFYNMLNEILIFDRNDMSGFISKYGAYLKNELMQFKDVYETYKYLGRKY